MKDYIFRFDKNLPGDDEDLKTALEAHDGMKCSAIVEPISDKNTTSLVEAIFEDGWSNLVFSHELEPC